MKKFVLLVISVLFILISASFFGVYMILNSSNYPLRFTDSISYDTKLKFLHNDKLFKQADTLIVGSSMGLNNINSSIIAKNTKNIHNVTNISSWGLQTTEVEELLNSIDLKNIKYVIYSTQMIDFVNPDLKHIDPNQIKEYTEGSKSYPNYLHMINIIYLKQIYMYDAEYMNRNKYTYLKFNKYGDVNLDFNTSYINKDRWDVPDSVILSKECFESLERINKSLKRKNIKLIVAIPPYRKKVLVKSQKLIIASNDFERKLNAMSKYSNFLFVNLHNQFDSDDSCFVDRSHLNTKGAIKYSLKISEYINSNN